MSTTGRRRGVADLRSDFDLSPSLALARPSKKQKQTPRRTHPLSVIDLERPVPDRQNGPLRSASALQHTLQAPNEKNVSTLSSTRILSPPPPPLPVQHSSKKSTKILQPPRLPNPPGPPRPSTPPKNVAAPDLSTFLSPLHDPLRPSKPMSRTHIALATDLWTEGGRADLLGLTLEQDGVQYATPTDKVVQRGLEVSPRKVGGIGKEIRYVRGGLAEQASQAIGKKMTALSLWRKSAPSPESASIIVEIEEVLDAPKHPPRRGGAGMQLCLARCRVEREDGSVVILFSVPAHDAKRVAMTAASAGQRVALWEPLMEVERGLCVCTRFVLL